MDKFEKFTQIINNIYNTDIENNFSEQIFILLKNVIEFTSGYIFFLNPERLEYSFNPQANCIKDIQQPYIKENLKFKNSLFGVVILTGNNFAQDDKKIFNAFASILANIIKDIELKKVIKMQIEALQQAYVDVHKNSEKIKEADKLKTKFLSNITHELRTPLTSILGFSELLSNEFAGKLNKKQKDYVNDIKISSINLLGMINEILDMSKIEANLMKLNLQKFYVSTAINEVVNTLAPLIMKKNIQFNKFINCEEITADYQKFQQILFNLLGNAIKFTPENGKISITASKNKNFFLLSVKDNGIGIDKKLHKKIFKRFEQAEKSGENSTGLGLAITMEFVKLHKGKITLKSEKNKGSEFIVSLPQNT